MIGLQQQHTQGACPMKDSANQGANRPGPRHRMGRAATLALLLPLALGSTAQTPLQWNAQPSQSVATVTTPQATRNISQPASVRRIAYVPPPRPRTCGFAHRALDSMPSSP